MQIVLLGLHAHLNSIFAHIIEYNFFYHILEDKETEVLQVLILIDWKGGNNFEAIIYPSTQDLVHALKLAPDKSSVNTSSCSEETGKDPSSSEDSNTKDQSLAEDISKMEVSKDQSITDESASSNFANVTKESDDAEDDNDKEEAVTNCDEKNTTADVEAAPTSGG